MTTQRHPLVWFITTFTVVTYIALCVLVNPPFVTLGQFDKASVDARPTDLAALAILIWFVGGLFVIRKRTGRSIVTFWLAGVFGGILVLSATFFVKGKLAETNVLESFWYGQGVGMLGIGWLIVLAPLWKLMKSEP